MAGQQPYLLNEACYPLVSRKLIDEQANASPMHRACRLNTVWALGRCSC